MVDTSNTKALGFIPAVLGTLGIVDVVAIFY
jgi:hypothetical protein